MFFLELYIFIRKVINIFEGYWELRSLCIDCIYENKNEKKVLNFIWFVFSFFRLYMEGYIYLGVYIYYKLLLIRLLGLVG